MSSIDDSRTVVCRTEDNLYQSRKVRRYHKTMSINWWRVARIACYVLLLISAIGENLLLVVIAAVGIALDIAEYFWERHMRNRNNQQSAGKQ